MKWMNYLILLLLLLLMLSFFCLLNGLILVLLNWVGRSVGRLVTIGTSGSIRLALICVCVCVFVCTRGPFLNPLILMLNRSGRLVRGRQLCWPNQRGWYPGRYPPGISEGGKKKEKHSNFLQVLFNAPKKNLFFS